MKIINITKKIKKVIIRFKKNRINNNNKTIIAQAKKFIKKQVINIVKDK
jgi:hypothetical protein